MDEPNRWQIAAGHHREARRYKLLCLIEGAKGHLVTERPGPNRQELLDSLAFFEAELERLAAEAATDSGDTVVRFRHRGRGRSRG